MAARLTDRQRKKIIADYLDIGSYNAVAKKHKISKDTVRRIVQDTPDFAQKAQKKKEQNTEDILAYMETKRDMVNKIIDKYLTALLDDNKIGSATPAQLTTAMGTLIDKFTMARAVEAGKHTEEDPLTKALKEEARRMEHGDIEEAETDTRVSVHEV